jgi:hypothetical protein
MTHRERGKGRGGERERRRRIEKRRGGEKGREKGREGERERGRVSASRESRESISNILLWEWGGSRWGSVWETFGISLEMQMK